MKTTKKHFGIFKKEVQRLIEVYGLVSYEVYIDHDVRNDTTLADTIVDLEARNIIITLNTDWADKITTPTLKDTALHEIFEVLFWRIESFAGKAYKEDARAEVHSLIQTFINVQRGNNG